MKQIVVPASFPYTVEFIRRRCRTVEDLIVWDEGAVAIYDVDDREAPVAYRVDSSAPSRPGYEIRSFQGRIWWPVFDGLRALSADAFVARLDDPNGCFLAAMNLSPSTLYSSRSVTTKRFEADVSIGRIPGFAVDEPVETLGQELKLPSFLEPHRKDIEKVLQPLERAA